MIDLLLLGALVVALFFFVYFLVALVDEIVERRKK